MHRFILGIVFLFSTGSLKCFADPAPTILYLISLPRSLTTAFERSMIERGDLYVLHEPFWKFQRKNFLKIQSEIELHKMHKIVRESSTFDQMLTEIDLLAQTENKSVFIKDFAVSTADELMLREEYIKRSDIRFVFLFREPEKTILSLLLQIRGLSGISRTIDPIKMLSYQKLWEFYEYVKQVKGKAPLLISTQSLLDKSTQASVIKSSCKAFGIPFIENQLKWEPGAASQWHPDSKTWRAGVENSNGFSEEVITLSKKLTYDELSETEKVLFKTIFEEGDTYYHLLHQEEIQNKTFNLL